MNNFEISVIQWVNHDIIKAISLLRNLDHNFPQLEGVGHYHAIVGSCRQILETVSEELVQTVVREDAENERL
jgi:transcriptional regulator of NAD metabolism